MPRSYYLGNFVPKRYLKDEYSYDRASVSTSQDMFSRLTKDQLLEMTQTDAQKVIRNGTLTKPVTSVEHLEMDNSSDSGEVVDVGSADALWLDSDQGMLGTFSVDTDKDGGEMVQRLIDNGYFSELSLSHYHSTLEPKEVSICKKVKKTQVHSSHFPLLVSHDLAYRSTSWGWGESQYGLLYKRAKPDLPHPHEVDPYATSHDL